MKTHQMAAEAVGLGLDARRLRLEPNDLGEGLGVFDGVDALDLPAGGGEVAFKPNGSEDVRPTAGDQIVVIG